MNPYRTKATRISIAASLSVLGALSSVTLAHAQATGNSAAPSSADVEVQALKQELAEQRALLNKLLDAQASQKQAIEKIEANPVQQSAAHTASTGPSSFLPNGFTMYGTFDVDVSSANSGYGRKTTVGSGGMSQSSIGFKADKPLGDTGFRAVGEVEIGIDLSTGVAGNGPVANGINSATPSSGSLLGTGSAIFARQAYAGLATDYGQFLLGREYTGAYFAQLAGSAFGPGFYGSSLLFLPPIGGSPARWNNTITYRSPTFAGLYLWADWTAGSENNINSAILTGTSTQTDNSGKGWDIAAFYHNGAITGSFGTWHIKNTSYAAGETGLATKTGWVAAGNYDFGFTKLFAAYMTGKINGGNYSNITQTLSKSDGFTIGTNIPFGNHTFIASYSQLNDKSLQNRDASVIGIGYTYKLYDRTWLYVNYAKLTNKGNSSYSLMNGGDLVGSVSAPGFDPSGFMMGINMKF